LSALTLVARVLPRIAAILLTAIPIRLVLIGAVALARLAIAIAHVLRVAVLVASRGTLLALLIFMAFLIGHGFPPSDRLSE